jgi:hypothetical protein
MRVPNSARRRGKSITITLFALSFCRFLFPFFDFCLLARALEFRSRTLFREGKGKKAIDENNKQYGVALWPKKGKR